MKTVSVYEARNRFSQLLKEAAAGEEIIVANRGEPVARITGIPCETRKLRPGSWELIARWLANNKLPDYARRTHEEIKRGIQDERNAWD